MKIKFNKKIYSQQTVKKAIKDYSYLADFEVDQGKNYFLVKIKNIKQGLKENFKDEFSNYILSLKK